MVNIQRLPIACLGFQPCHHRQCCIETHTDMISRVAFYTYTADIVCVLIHTWAYDNMG